MSKLKRNYPSDACRVLGDSSNKLPISKKRCLHTSENHLNGFQTNAHIVDGSKTNQIEMDCQNSNQEMTPSLQYAFCKESVQNNTITSYHTTGSNGNVPNNIINHPTTSYTCPRCQAGEPGHIGHIDR